MTAEPSPLIALGSEVPHDEVLTSEGIKGLANVKKGNVSEIVYCRLVAVEDAASFVDSLRSEWAVPSKAPGQSTPIAEEDARTLSVLFDDHGDRWRDWKNAVSRSDENFYEDWPLEGPRTVLWLMKHVDRTGSSPTSWYNRFLSEARISATDRSAYELQTMARMIELAACYDQLNLPSLACFEVLARRWQLLLDANSRDPGDPKFEDEELWAGQAQRSFGIAPQLTAHVAARTKEKAEIEKQRQKAKELRALNKGPPARK